MQVLDLLDGALGVVGQARVDLDADPAVDALRGGMDLGEHVGGLTHVIGGEHLHHGLDVLALAREARSEEHTSELQARGHLGCRLLREKQNCIRRSEEIACSSCTTVGWDYNFDTTWKGGRLCWIRFICQNVTARMR